MIITFGLIAGKQCLRSHRWKFGWKMCLYLAKKLKPRRARDELESYDARELSFRAGYDPVVPHNNPFVELRANTLCNFNRLLLLRT